MWQLNNETPFAAETTWTRDERGAEFWLVAVRASFVVDADGVQRLAEKQTEVQRAPVFSGDPMTTGLVTDGDFYLSKVGTDVLVEGVAMSRDGRPVTRAPVRFRVADVDKQLIAVGHRRIYEGAVGLGLTDPEPFTEMPLTWENAYGGWDQVGGRQGWEPRNPAGRGYATDGAHLVGTQAPTVEAPDAPYSGPGRGIAVGIGPVAHHWQPRVRYAGTYDGLWEKTRDPLPPDDFDRRYFRCAPEDQQTVKPLVGYEDVAVGGMTRDGLWRFRLPRLVFNIRTTFRDRGDVPHPASIHTLWLKPSERRFEIVWLSALEVPPGREEKLVVTHIGLRPRRGAPEGDRRTWRPQ